MLLDSLEVILWAGFGEGQVADGTCCCWLVWLLHMAPFQTYPCQTAAMGVEVLKLKWRPLEGKMSYNIRTSVLIKIWFCQHGKQPMYYRALLAVFKNAWRERSLPTHGAENYLSLSREFRCRAFWDIVKDMGRARLSSGIVHAGIGPRTEWEDVLCIELGNTWRLKRDTCSSMQDWLKMFPHFASSLCKRWGLPVFGNAGEQGQEPMASPLVKRRKVLHPLEDLPKHHGDECPPVNWRRERGCSCFIVDCEPLAQVLSGHAPLRVPSMTPLFERMAGTLFDLLEAGLTPCRQSEDPVLWHRREFNKIADFK